MILIPPLYVLLSYISYTDYEGIGDSGEVTQTLMGILFFFFFTRIINIDAMIFKEIYHRLQDIIMNFNCKNIIFRSTEQSKQIIKDIY